MYNSSHLDKQGKHMKGKSFIKRFLISLNPLTPEREASFGEDLENRSPIVYREQGRTVLWYGNPLSEREMQTLRDKDYTKVFN